MNEHAFILRTRYGFTVYAVTASGCCFAESTWQTIEGAILRAIKVTK